MSAPTPALAALLDGPSRWHTIDHRATVGSTNDVATAALADGVPPGLVVVADHQTAGRGRRGRVWEDRPDGATLLLSVTTGRPSALSLVPLAAGSAVADAVEALGLSATLKWPNDVLVAGRKLAGVLAEAQPDGVVLGIGVNVDLRSSPIAGATSVAAALGRDTDRWDVLVELLRAVDRRLAQLDDGLVEEVLSAHDRRSSTLGEQVVVELADGTELRGRAIAIDPSGALVVEEPDGARTQVTAGDVHHLR